MFIVIYVRPSLYSSIRSRKEHTHPKDTQQCQHKSNSWCVAYLRNRSTHYLRSTYHHRIQQGAVSFRARCNLDSRFRVHHRVALRFHFQMRCIVLARKCERCPDHAVCSGLRDCRKVNQSVSCNHVPAYMSARVCVCVRRRGGVEGTEEWVD